MFHGFAAPALPQTATKRIVIYWVGVSLSFLAAVLFSFHGGLQAPKNISAKRGISAVATQNQPRLAASYGKLPLSFEVNQGQTDPQVKFLSRGRGYTLFLTGDAAVLELQESGVRSQESEARIQDSGFRIQEAPPSGLESPSILNRRVLIGGARHWLAPSGTSGQLQRTTDNGPRTKYLIQNPKPKIENQVVRLRLVGANPDAVGTGGDELPGKANYFIGNDPKKWRTNVPTYAKVRYQNVYPGVDLVYYGNQSGQLEYDFVVAPGADPSAITLDVGAERTGRNSKLENRNSAAHTSLQIAGDGDLVISTEGGDMRLHKPLVYQERSTVDSRQLTVQDDSRQSKIENRHLVDGHYVLAANNQVSFGVSGYDKTRPLVIDPVLSYSTYLGGSGFDEGFGIAADSSGNVYVTGRTSSTNFPTVNPLQTSNKSLAEYPTTAFVAKLNAVGSALVYSTYLGGSGVDMGFGISVDSSGNAYVAGDTSSTDFPTVNALQEMNKSPAGGSTGFVAKLNAAGSALIYSTYLGGSGGDGVGGIAVDASGDAYVAGGTQSTDFPTVNPLQATNKAPAGSSTGFVAKLNATGSALVYSTYLGGSGGDGAGGIAVDASGNAYVAGGTQSTDFPTVNPVQATLKSGYGNAFVAKLNGSGSALVYSTYLGGSGSDAGFGVAVDSSGNAYVAGDTTSTNFPTVNPVQASNKSSNFPPVNAFVAELDASGSALVYSTYLGGSVLDYAFGVAVDSSGNAYVVGGAESADFPVVNPFQATPCGGLRSPFVANLNAAGSSLVYSTCLGSGGYWGQANGIAVDSSGNAYVTGQTNAVDFPTVNPVQPTYGGGDYNGFVAELSLGPAPAVSFSTPALNFGLVSTTSPPDSVTVTNFGNALLSIAGITASGDFALVPRATSCPYGGGTVAAEANCTIDVTFTPTATGVRTGTVTVTDNASGSPHTVQLSGTGILSAPNVSPTSLSFNNQQLGTASTPQPVTVTNTGSLGLSISNLAITSGWTQSNNCLPSVAPGASCTINVSFQPAAGGFQTGALTLTDNASNSPQTVTLSGTGVGPTTSLSASSLTFASQLVGTASSAQPVTLQNAGNQALSITSISLTGANSGDFSLSQNCPSSLAANASCQINVTFTPTARGARTAALSLVDSAANSPQSIALTGTGIAPVANLSPGSLTFPGQFVGTTGLPENITLTNNGDAPLNISSIQASGQFGTSNGCTSSLAVGVNCTISVFFDPSAAGSQTGTLTITDNAPGSPQTVALSGMGMDFQMSSSTTSQTVSAGQSANYSLAVAPEGGLNQTVKLTCSGAPSLSTCTLTPSSVALNGTASAAVTVAVTTTAGSLAPPSQRVLPPSLRGLGGMFWLYALLGLASVGALAGAGKRRAACLLGACLLMVMVWSACGGGTPLVPNPGTPAGTYTLDVSGTVTSSATPSSLTHDIKFTLTVD
jgi:hypothetical protein